MLSPGWQHSAALGRLGQPCCIFLQEDELAEHAQWCRRFASVNATGLRKIAKKHDKYAQNDAGKQFVQVWLQKGASDPLFVHSRLPNTSVRVS
jgi:SPX domain protein involved in polyphosphate accumulation